MSDICIYTTQSGKDARNQSQIASQHDKHVQIDSFDWRNPCWQLW